MKTTNLTYLSYDNETQIQAWLKEPNKVASGKDLPRAVIQVVHGAAEHSGRYSHIAKHLVDQGFVVCGEDHVGHGKSAASPDDLGHIPAENGDRILIEDVHSLRETVQKRYLESVPYIMLGHSMGSFIVRVYISIYGDGLDAVVLSGTAEPRMATMLPTLAYLKRVVKKQGERTVSTNLHKLGLGSYSRVIKDRRTDFDWICTDPEVVDAYIADPLCGFMFTNGAYLTLATLMRNMVSVEKGFTPANLRILCLAGGKDPVSKFGRAPKAMAASFKRALKGDVETALLSDARHEIFNEPDWKKTLNTLITWMEHRLGV